MLQTKQYAKEEEEAFRKELEQQKILEKYSPTYEDKEWAKEFILKPTLKEEQQKHSAQAKRKEKEKKQKEAQQFTEIYQDWKQTMAQTQLSPEILEHPLFTPEDKELVYTFRPRDYEILLLEAIGRAQTTGLFQKVNAMTEEEFEEYNRRMMDPHQVLQEIYDFEEPFQRKNDPDNYPNTQITSEFKIETSDLKALDEEEQRAPDRILDLVADQLDKQEEKQRYPIMHQLWKLGLMDVDFQEPEDFANDPNAAYYQNLLDVLDQESPK